MFAQQANPITALDVLFRASTGAPGDLNNLCSSVRPFTLFCSNEFGFSGWGPPSLADAPYSISICVLFASGGVVQTLDSAKAMRSSLGQCHWSAWQKEEQLPWAPPKDHHPKTWQKGQGARCFPSHCYHTRFKHWTDSIAFNCLAAPAPARPPVLLS